jgi:hypothetical protein
MNFRAPFLASDFKREAVLTRKPTPGPKPMAAQLGALTHRRLAASCSTMRASLRYRGTGTSGPTMNLHLGLTPLISLLAGILILAVPRLLNFIVAIYLIVVGLIGIFGASGMRLN